VVFSITHDMTFTQAENFLLSLSNMPRKEYMGDPKKCDVYLKRMQFFLDILGNPEKKIPHYIHIAGTSGKGSTTNFLHSILHEDKRRVGSTLSPHPSIITERWRVGTSYMTKKEFIEITELIKKGLDIYIKKSPYGTPSFFEITTAIAFLYFAKKKVEWAIIEVGCGGRFDSANILKKKDVSVITNIGLDHQHLLGDTKEQIAWEKAGIIKPGTKVFTGEQDPKILKVIEKECKKQKIKTLTQVTQRDLHITDRSADGTTFQYKGDEYSLRVLGDHQVRNATLCIEIINTLNIPQTSIARGLRKAKQPMRMEIVSKRPLTILDGAHNPDKMKTTVQTMKNISKSSNQHTHLVLGFSGNKDIKKMLELLKKLNIKSIACTRNTINHFRKVAGPDDLAAQCRTLFPKATISTFMDPIDAFSWSKKQSKKSDTILVTGSLFVSGEIRNRVDI